MSQETCEELKKAGNQAIKQTIKQKKQTWIKNALNKIEWSISLFCSS